MGTDHGGQTIVNLYLDRPPPTVTKSATKQQLKGLSDPDHRPPRQLVDVTFVDFVRRAFTTFSDCQPDCQGMSAG